MDEAVISESHSALPNFTEPQPSSEQLRNVNSSENMPNTSGDCHKPSNDTSSSEPLPTQVNETDCNMLLDEVSSTSETYLGTIKQNLPSINHQSVLIPNMEPYLEEGSLDGSPKEDPTSSNGTSIMEKADINSSNGPSSSEFIPLNLLENVHNPAPQENLIEQNTVGSETVEQTALDSTYETVEPLTKDTNHTFNDVERSPVSDTRKDDVKLTEASIAPEISSQPHFVSDENTPDQIFLMESSYQPNLQENAHNSDDSAPVKTYKEESNTATLPLDKDETASQKVDDAIQEICNPATEINAEPHKGELGIEPTESAKEIHSKSAECTFSNMLVNGDNSQLFEHQPNNLKTSVSDYSFSCNEELKDHTISPANQHLETTKVEDSNQMGEKTQTEYIQYGQTEETPPQQEVQATNASVCEADSSAVGLNSAVFSGEGVTMGSQSVYVVDDGMALNSIPQSGSMTPYHNPENTMLVEMAPLPTDGSYVNSHTQVYSFIMMDIYSNLTKFSIGNFLLALILKCFYFAIRNLI